MKSLTQTFLSVLLVINIAGCNSDKVINQNELFDLLSPESTGIEFQNSLNDTSDITVYDSDLIYAGAGVAAGDINNDDLVDLFFVGNQKASKLYLNKGGLKFEDITNKSGIFNQGWNTGTVMADVNGDGLLDIYVCTGGYKKEKEKRNLLFINNGDLTFTEKAKEFGIDDNGLTQSASFFDYDNDGDLDLYVVNSPDGIEKSFQIEFYLDPSLIDPLNCSHLYENKGNKFIDVTKASNINYTNADGFNASIGDINNDGFQDIYVNNDLMQPDFLFLNNGNKTFTESRSKHINTVPMFSMGSSFMDINNDGRLDLMTTEMMPPEHDRRKNNMPHPDAQFYNYVLNTVFKSEQHSRNMLQVQNEDGTFSEIGELGEISRTDWSWASLGCDFDNDGWEDLFITNGVKKDLFDQTYLSVAFEGKEFYDLRYRRNRDELIRNFPVHPMANYIFKNNGDLTFTKKTKAWGVNQMKAASSGAAYADLNNDGYPELIVNNTDTFAFIYKNKGADLLNNNFLKVKLAGANKNTFGLGAKVFLYDNGKLQFRQLQNSLGWYSSSEPAMFFGLGKDSVLDSLKVIWPGGKTETLNLVKGNQTLTLSEKNATTKPTAQPVEETLFTDVTPSISPNFVHQEKPFLDYSRDKLIPKMLSKEGPGIAVADVNSDGREDFFVGGASGQAGKLYLQTADGNFAESKSQPWEKDAEFEDMGVLFTDLNGDGSKDLYVVSGSNEFDKNSPFLKDRIYLNDGYGKFQSSMYENLPGGNSKACITSADINGDGRAEIFVFGRVSNTDYPAEPESYIFSFEKNKLTDVTGKYCPALKKLGMVTDAKTVDINNDNKVDLVLCGEYLPVMIFINDGEKLVDNTKEFGLEWTNGWWNSIAIADLNNDGFLDIVGGNYGLNSQLKSSKQEPVTCYFDDFDKNGTNDPLLCNYRFGKLAPVADRDLFTRQMPFFTNRFLTYKTYGAAELTDIFTDAEIHHSKKYNAYNFETSVFYNNANRSFTVQILPMVVQTAPVYGITLFDFDGDGRKDIFLTGNTKSSYYEDGIMMNLRGTVLRNNGINSWQVMNLNKSGISLNKDTKACGMVYNNFHKTYDMLITCNNDMLKAYRLNKSTERRDYTGYNSGYLFTK